MNLKFNGFVFLFIEKITKIISRLTFRYANMRIVYAMLSLIAFIFKRFLAKKYSSSSALYLARSFFKYGGKDFSRLLILNKLMSEYIRISLNESDWMQIRNFLDRNCYLLPSGNEPGKLLLFTHTGDYWLSILTMARQYQNMGCEFIVPVYQPITDEILEMYKKINIPGVDVLFINIHDTGALLKIIRYLKNPKSVVAIFYDLFCYCSGVYNGAVDSVNFFNRKGYMTTGILSVAEKMKLGINFVSSVYSISEKKYVVKMSPSALFSGKSDVDKLMLRYVESCIKENPHQWHFMTSLDSYYHAPYSQLKLKNERELAKFARLNYKYTHPES